MTMYNLYSPLQSYPPDALVSERINKWSGLARILLMLAALGCLMMGF